MQKLKNSSVARNIAMLGIFSALAVVSSMWLTVRIGEFIKISPMFIVVALAGNMYGVGGAVTVALVSDLLQSLTAGLGFSPLILTVNVLCAACFGLALHNSKNGFKITMSVLFCEVIGGLLLKTMVFHFRQGVPYVPLVYWRAVQCGIMVVVEIAALWLLLSVLDVPSKLRLIGRK